MEGSPLQAIVTLICYYTNWKNGDYTYGNFGGEMKVITSLDWKQVELLILDVDGVMTDGKIIIASDGTELKHFSTLDGIGLKGLLMAGIEVAIISARRSVVTEIRAKEIGIERIFMGGIDKSVHFIQLKNELNLNFASICYIGDDDIDIPLLKASGIGVAVPNGTCKSKKAANFLTDKAGGDGAVREVCDLILESRGTSIEALFCTRVQFNN